MIAGAINFIGGDTLFGRHWGAIEHHPFLHFEVCYYQAIEFAIAHGLKTVEAGAQGEHKIARGYLPQTTYSAHFIADPALRRAIADYLKQRARLCRAWPRKNSPRPGRFARPPTSLDRGAAATATVALDKFRSRHDRLRSRRTSSPKSCAANSPATRSTRTTTCCAFLDIMPRAPGHTLVIPKAPARNILDIDPEDFAHVARGAHTIARAAKIAFKADGITLQQFSEAGRRPGGVSPAHARNAAPRRRAAAAARQPQGRARRCWRATRRG